VLLFLPEYEHHELGLLFVYYLLRKEGIAAIYLGANVPMNDLKYIVDVKRPAFLYTHLTSFPRQLQFKKFVGQLGALEGDTKILLSGGVVSRYGDAWPANVKALKTLGELTSFLSSL
jgi:methanogenic corrinoid protein MtbC1